MYKNIAETLMVIMINIGAWVAPLEDILKILALMATLVFTLLQIAIVYKRLKGHMKDARNKTDKS